MMEVVSVMQLRRGSHMPGVPGMPPPTYEHFYQLKLKPEPWTPAPEVGVRFECDIVNGTVAMSLDMRDLEPISEDFILVWVKPDQEKEGL